MTGDTPKPFAKFEWMIAWRYLRARQSEGGVTINTWISLIGITLAVFALVATMAIRSGFRQELVDATLGSNAHVTVYQAGVVDQNGRIDTNIYDYEAMAEAVREIPGVERAAPLIRENVMLNNGDRNAGAQIYGMRAEDVRSIPRIGNPLEAQGSLDNFENGIALGGALARELGLFVGDKVKVITANGVPTPFGNKPRVSVYEVVYIFTSGRYLVDNTRAYLPLAEAQLFFAKDDAAEEIEVMVVDPENIDGYAEALQNAAGPRALLWTWMDSNGEMLRTLTIEDNVMMVLMSILVLIAAMNIISGLVMLVKNKSRDIGILRTMGLTRGSILRIFFICGALIGTVGTVVGVILGSLFAKFVDPIFSFVNYVSGGGIWEPSIRGIYYLPAKLEGGDIAFAVGLSLLLSWTITLIPAWRAAKLNPVEALRDE